MSTRFAYIARGAAAIALGASLVAAAAPASSHWGGPDRGFDMQDPSTQERMREHTRTRLDRLAQRLEIKASQQEAWTAYTTTALGLVGTGLKKPAADADAATIVHHRADMTAERAQKLSQLADATARLQQVLTADQRKVLDEAARHAGPMMGGHRGPGGRHGHGGPGGPGGPRGPGGPGGPGGMQQ